MITARSGLEAASIADSMYAVGGLLGFTYLDINEMYYFNPASIAYPSFHARLSGHQVELVWEAAMENWGSWRDGCWDCLRGASSSACLRTWGKTGGSPLCCTLSSARASDTLTQFYSSWEQRLPLCLKTSIDYIYLKIQKKSKGKHFW